MSPSQLRKVANETERGKAIAIACDEILSRIEARAREGFYELRIYSDIPVNKYMVGRPEVAFDDELFQRFRNEGFTVERSFSAPFVPAVSHTIRW